MWVASLLVVIKSTIRKESICDSHCEVSCSYGSPYVPRRFSSNYRMRWCLEAPQSLWWVSLVNYSKVSQLLQGPLRFRLLGFVMCTLSLGSLSSALGYLSAALPWCRQVEWFFLPFLSAPLAVGPINFQGIGVFLYLKLIITYSWCELWELFL